MKPLAALDAQEILRPYPDLLEILEGEQPTSYEYVAVSVFDRWVTDGVEAKELLSVTSEDEFERKIAPLKAFTEKILRREPRPLRVVWSERGPVVWGFSSIDEAVEYALQGGGEKSGSDHFRFLLPSLKAVYCESWDFTNVIFLRDAVGRSLVQEVGDSANVHLLEKTW